MNVGDTAKFINPGWRQYYGRIGVIKFNGQFFCLDSPQGSISLCYNSKELNRYLAPLSKLELALL